jgi:hypothetical protein
MNKSKWRRRKQKEIEKKRRKKKTENAPAVFHEAKDRPTLDRFFKNIRPKCFSFRLQEKKERKEKFILYFYFL